MSPHVEVRKTYKLYIGGKFPRSESGRSYEVYAAPSPRRTPGCLPRQRRRRARARMPGTLWSRPGAPSPRGPARRHTTGVRCSTASPR
jgi:hypothetical protein